MSFPILHHFEASPFSEKVRLLLGYRGLEWGSVLIPRIMPKLSLTALTGGYRKTPILQIGRDIYCDTTLILRVVANVDGGFNESVSQSPALEPEERRASVRAMERMGDRLFLAAIPVLFRPEGRSALAEQLGESYLQRFQADRGELFSGGSVSRPDAQFSSAVWEPTLAALNDQLGQTDFMLGNAPTYADFSLYHPLWYVRANPGVAATLDVYPQLMAWFERMRAFGHGQRRELDEAAARRLIGESRSWQPLLESPIDSREFAAGDDVVVHATDYGVDRVAGRLVQIGRETLTLERQVEFGGERLGMLRVHFPRDGFAIETAESRAER